MIETIWNIYKRRKRLQVCHRLKTGSTLKRYKDPKTGKHYVAHSRYDPAMVQSVVDKLGIECELGVSE